MSSKLNSILEVGVRDEQFAWEFHRPGAQQNFRYLNNVVPGDGASSSPSSVSGASVNVSSAAVTIGEGMINITGTPGSMIEGVLVIPPA